MTESEALYSETLWREISVAAMLGTRRRPFRASQANDRAPGELGSMLYVAAQHNETADSADNDLPADESSPPVDEPDPSGSERRLLRATAITAFYRRAGQLPIQKTPAFPPPASAEEWPRCSLRAGRCLELILDDQEPAGLVFLPEWVEIATASKKRVREEHLPVLLDQLNDQRKATQPLHRALIPQSKVVWQTSLVRWTSLVQWTSLVHVLGARGRWLAAQNPDWSALVFNPVERAWSDGQRKERLAYLEDLRAQDPDRARELLAEAWPQEALPERLAFLQTLADGLSMADEPFLETVLDDRRKDVRQAAAALLARLPGSRLARRMAARARAMLNWRAGLLRSDLFGRRDLFGRPSLEVTLPDTCDASMQRDGIDPRPPAGSNLGEKAWCFAQVLFFVPPRTWSAAWNKRPAQILDVLHKHEWEEALLAGWEEAALRDQDAEWLEALVNHAFKIGDQKRITDLFPRLPASVKERLTISLLREYPTLSYDQNASYFLSTCRHPWGAELTQAVVTGICQTLQKSDFSPWRWEKLLRDIPPHFHPDQLEYSVERIASALKKKEGGDPFVASLLAALDFRLEMRRGFEEKEIL